MNTVKKITLAMAFLCAATAANAQEQQAEGIKYGARIGLDFTTVICAGKS